MPISPATTSAVWAASPVTITVRTPNAASSATSAAESDRGGSLSAIRPTIRKAPAGPIAVASTRYPLPCKTCSAASACGSWGTRPDTASYAPFTTRNSAPSAPRIVASARLSARSNATKRISVGASATGLPKASARIAASTGSRPPSELARAANISNLGFVETRHRLDAHHRQFVSRQRACLVRA